MDSATFEQEIRYALAENYFELAKAVTLRALIDWFYLRYPLVARHQLATWRKNDEDGPGKGNWPVDADAWMRAHKNQLEAYWLDGGEELAYAVGLSRYVQKRHRRLHWRRVKALARTPRNDRASKKHYQMTGVCADCGVRIDARGRFCIDCYLARR